MTTKKLPPIRRLTCCCCGASTIGRQWWNRDTGFGLCADCIPFVHNAQTAADMVSSYGEHGIHYDLQPTTTREENYIAKIDPQ